jgi:hypothetical protein
LSFVNFLEDQINQRNNDSILKMEN